VQPAALATRSIGAMQQAALAACITYKYLHATEEHFARCLKWRGAVRSIAFASRCICCTLKTRLERLAREKHSRILGLFLSYRASFM
jgi:hypothetical protein